MYIEGRFTTRKYETNDGQKRTVSEIVAESIEMLDPKRDVPPLPPEPEQKLSYNP
ncbi:single-stranded DNA-binding protein [Bacteroides fragilis]|nr:single-stranded DNA-binding protein [Bacteroides fragilis]